VLDVIRVYLHLVSARVRGQMQYRTSFVLALVSSAASTIIEFGAVVILFGRVPSIAGWSLCEIALLYALAELSFSVAELFSSGLYEFQLLIAQGTFDRILVRPRGPFFQVLSEDLALRRFGRIGQGAIVLVFALRCADVTWNLDKMLVLLLALASGVTIFFSIFVLAATFCFWTVEGKEATHVFSYGGVTLADYPLEVYTEWMQRFVTFVLPLAFVSYYPALYLLDRTDGLGLPAWMRLLSPIAAVLLALAAKTGWSLGVRHYQSTGS
jgi:ABC-2 type transport system permease protein